MVKLIAKAASVRAMQDKKERGADGIEWQLISTGNVLVDSLVLPIYNVHTRLYGSSDVCLDMAYNCSLGINDGYDYQYLLEALELAEWLGEQQGFRINVITHMYYDGFVQKKDKFAIWLEELLENYTHCNILVENSCVATPSGRFRSMLDVNTVPNFVEGLQSEMSGIYKDRLGTVLDFCHLISSYRTFMTLVKEEGLGIKEYALSSEFDYITEAVKGFSKTCKTIHFNNSTKLGMKKTNHGTVFGSECYEVELFKHIMKLYFTYLKNSNMVLEVREDDVDKGENFEFMVGLIKNFEEENRSLVAN